MTSLYKDEVLNKDDFRAPLRSGFTLIELLVVVLIVAILAAIALPQYQLSVEKSRMAEAIILLKTIASAHQYYYLTHGTYLNSGGMDKLDISIENNITPKMASRKQTQYFLYSQEISPTSGYLAAAKRLPSSTED
ncbi:MAG: prepilin-type N-terminal cleavage/methylation domain-containing protein, partial [Elusimicrobiaceae bacterium]|nr:prepilin-type N-terminal cleavage/methylation domain-containing protein [Elusimicrobiaceae bacterium]